MPKKEPYNGEITPEKLREVLWADDFTKMPVRDPSEYNEKEAKLYKTVEKYIKQHWDRIAKVLAGTYAPNAYSEDFPTEVLRTRFTALLRTMSLSCTLTKSGIVCCSTSSFCRAL